MVDSGHTVQLTRRGVPVARIIPEPKTSEPLSKLVATGTLQLAANPRPIKVTQPLASPGEVRAVLAEVQAENL